MEIRNKKPHVRLRSMALLLSLFVLALANTAMAGDGDTGYRIESWKYEADVHPDNTWDVTETLKVLFTEESHGIYRYIPRRYARHHETSAGNAKFTYRLRIDSVWANVPLAEEDVDDSRDNLLLRLGDGNATVIGPHTYVIRYSLTYPDDRYAASDEICHTLLGTDCNTEIGEFDFTLHFDDALPASFRQAMRTYSGESGAVGNDLDVDVRLADHEIAGHATGIAPYNAITIQGDLPEGYWQAPYAVSPTPCITSLGVAALLFCMLMCYLLFLRRKSPTKVIEYNAPDGMSSAEVGVIVDDSADLRDLTSLIVWFASKGYLKIRELEGKKRLLGRDEPDLELVKLKPLPDDAPEYQKKFWGVFFSGKDSVVLSKLGDKHKEIFEALVALHKHFKGRLTRLHLPTVLLALAYLAAGTAALGTSSCVAASDDAAWMFAILTWTLPLAFVSILRICLSNYDMIVRTRLRLMQYLGIMALGAVHALVYSLFVYEQHDCFLQREAMLAVIASGWMVALFSGRMMRDSAYRIEKMSLLLGFREFIEKSELPMLKAQVDENPSYFYDVLPYAMVFGLTKKWQKQFREIGIPAPVWYECSNAPESITTYMLADRIIHNMSHSMENSIKVSSQASAASSGSSSFGGGFSGAGGAGGGVGRWCLIPFLLLTLASCQPSSGDGSKRLPSSKGQPSELLLVVDKAIWNTDVADTLRGILQGDVPGLMQHEDYFRTVRVFSEDYRRIYTTMHSKLYVTINPSLEAARIGAASDVAATPQLEVYVESPDMDRLRSILSRSSTYLRDLIGDFQLEMRQGELRRKYSRKVSDDLGETLGMSIMAPANITSTKKGKDFLWGSSNLAEKDLNIVVYAYPWDGSDALTVENFVGKRDSVMKANIPGSREDQWMETVREGDEPIVSSRRRMAGKTLVQEIRGLWQMRNGALGGPFVSVARIDTPRSRVIVGEGFVYSPNTDKRELVRKLEASLRTLNCIAGSGSHGTD